LQKGKKLTDFQLEINSKGARAKSAVPLGEGTRGTTCREPTRVKGMRD